MIEFIIVGLLIFFAVILAVQEYKTTFNDHKLNNRCHMIIENATYICNECGRNTRLSREYECTNLEFAQECKCEHCGACATLNRIDNYHYEI